MLTVLTTILLGTIVLSAGLGISSVFALAR